MVAPHLKHQQRENTPPSSSPPPIVADNKEHSSPPTQARQSRKGHQPQVTNFHTFNNSSPFLIKTPATPESDLKKAVIPFAAPSSKRQATGLQTRNGSNDQAVALQNAVLKTLRQQLEAAETRCEALQAENSVLRQAAQSNGSTSPQSPVEDLAARCAALEAEIVALKQAAQSARAVSSKSPDVELAARCTALENENKALREASQSREFASSYSHDEELAAVCAALKAANAALRQAAQSSGSTSSNSPDKPRGRSTTTRPVQNLTGYDTSDDDGSQAPAAEPPAQQPLDSKIDMIEQILVNHEHRLLRTEDSVAETSSENKSMKAATEEMNIRLQAAEAKEPTPNPNPAETNSSLIERLNILELQTKQKQDQIDSLLAWKATIDEDAKSATDSAIVKSVSSQNVSADAELPELKKRVKKLERKIRQDDLIDDAASEDLLHAYYQRLSTAWNNNQHRAGDFKGSRDEIWSLKTRCVRRLGGFSSFENALREAKARKEYNGD